MEPDYKEVANRVKSLREDMDLNLAGDGLASTGRTIEEYAAQESGESESFSFTFLLRMRCKTLR